MAAWLAPVHMQWALTAPASAVHSLACAACLLRRASAKNGQGSLTARCCASSTHFAQEEAALAAAEAAVVSGGTAEYGEGEGDEEKTPVAGKRLPAEVHGAGGCMPRCSLLLAAAQGATQLG